MARKFKIGDRVKFIDAPYGDALRDNWFLGRVGTITGIYKPQFIPNPSYDITLDPDPRAYEELHDDFLTWACHEDDIEHLNGVERMLSVLD
jgi:hypothetical protein